MRSFLRSLACALPLVVFIFAARNTVAQEVVTVAQPAAITSEPWRDSTLSADLSRSFFSFSSIDDPALTSDSDESDLPDDPQPQNAPAQRTNKQTKRILGIIPNFRSVSMDEKLPPQSAKEKFISITEDSFDYSAIVIPAALAGYDMARKATPEFHQGMAGYGRYFWHSAVDQTSENYMVGFIIPVITHEDARYYTLGRGKFMKRATYALTRAVITRKDDGTNGFNYSEVVGAGASSGISTLYYPSRERTFGNVAQQWGLDIGIDAATFVFKEFWPDINHSILHGDKGDTVPPLK